MVTYDLNDIAEALAEVFSTVDSWAIGGQTADVTATPEAAGVTNTPGIVIELDDITWDVSMGRGADTFTFLAYLFVSTADSGSGQRLTRQLLSTGGAVQRLKDALEADKTLGDRVSFAHMTGTRSIGSINYAGVAYQGAILEIVMVS